MSDETTDTMPSPTDLKTRLDGGDIFPKELVNILLKYPGSPTIRGMVETCFSLRLTDSQNTLESIGIAILERLYSCRPEAVKLDSPTIHNLLSNCWLTGKPNFTDLETSLHQGNYSIRSSSRRRDRSDYAAVDVTLAGYGYETVRNSYDFEETEDQVEISIDQIREAYRSGDYARLAQDLRDHLDPSQMIDDMSVSDTDYQDSDYGEVEVSHSALENWVTDYITENYPDDMEEVDND